MRSHTMSINDGDDAGRSQRSKEDDAVSESAPRSVQDLCTVFGARLYGMNLLTINVIGAQTLVWDRSSVLNDAVQARLLFCLQW